MKDFGYNISKDRQIDFDKTDKRFVRYIRQHEPSFNICISCGTCTATCSAGNYSELSLRKIITFIKRGEVIGLKAEISKCMFCGKCFLACPRGVNTRNVILKASQALERFGA